MRRQVFAALAIATAVIGTAGSADATKVFRWTDARGVTHYGDQPPDARASRASHAPDTPVVRLRMPAEPEAIARLRIERAGGRNLAWADNLLGGPIEVRLRFQRQRNMASDPALPIRATLPAGGSTLLAVLTVAQAGRGGDFQLQMDSLPGDPSARPRDVEYRLPLRFAAPRIDQGYGGRFSHADVQNRYAVDFAVPVGTPVLAARDGVVMQAESGFDTAGLDSARYGGRANYIRIVHDDGTMAVYAHLKPDGVLVRVGQRVRAGQQIGLSGNTGYTTGPHLHFAVQVNRGMRIESLPFQMRGPNGPLRIDQAR
jgi:murein DD-endopeptidase MepM/ murein hydrolase activator NlpD